MTTSPRNLLVLGCGKRVVETALPALARLDGSITLRRIAARKPRTIHVEGRPHVVTSFADVTARDLDGIDLVYVAVGKDAVPGVLRRLVELGAAKLELLIDTPLVRFRHFSHARHVREFRSASIAEDCIELPWIAALRALEASGEIGALREIVFARSAYAYHGFATAKAALGATRVLHAKRTKVENGARREVELDGGKRFVAHEPRDYAKGHVLVRGERGEVSDVRGAKVPLEPVLVHGEPVAIRAGATRIDLGADEAELLAGDPSSASLTARMESLKKVGFLRLWKRIARGEPAYGVADELEDMVADYHLEKFGRYGGGALTSPRSSLARAWMNGLLR